MVAEEVVVNTDRQDVYTVYQLSLLVTSEQQYTCHEDHIDASFQSIKGGTGTIRKEKCNGTLPCHWHRHNGDAPRQLGGY